MDTEVKEIPPFDEYTRRRYGAVASSDMKKWENISDKILFPKGARHGTVFAVPRSVLQNLLKNAENTTQPAARLCETSQRLM